MFEKKPEPEKKSSGESIEAELHETKSSCLPEALLISGLVVLGIILIRRARVPNKTVVHLVYYGGCWNPYHAVEQMAHLAGEAV